MKQINELDYLYASGRIRALEGSLLNRERTLYMVDARTPEDAFQQLVDCGYAIPSTLSVEDLEQLFHQERENIFNIFADIIPDPTLVDVFRVKYDIHNLKVLLKSNGNMDANRSLLVDCGRIKIDQLITLFREMDFKRLTPRLRDATEKARDVLARTSDPQLSDIILDRACLEEMLEIAKNTNIPFLIGYVQLLIDSANLRTVVRTHRMGKDVLFLGKSLIAGGIVSSAKLSDNVTDQSLEMLFSSTLLKEAAITGAMVMRHQGSMTELDFRCDNALTTYMRPAKMKAYGPALVIAFLVAKEAEMTALRTILTGRILDLPPEIIMERIRDHYV